MFDPPYGSNWGRNIADFKFFPFSPLMLPLQIENVLRGIGKAYVESLK